MFITIYIHINIYCYCNGDQLYNSKLFMMNELQTFKDSLGSFIADSIDDSKLPSYSCVVLYPIITGIDLDGISL